MFWKPLGSRISQRQPVQESTPQPHTKCAQGDSVIAEQLEQRVQKRAVGAGQAGRQRPPSLGLPGPPWEDSRSIEGPPPRENVNGEPARLQGFGVRAAPSSRSLGWWVWLSRAPSCARTVFESACISSLPASDCSPAMGRGSRTLL